MLQRRATIVTGLALLGLLALAQPGVALAHGANHQPSSMAGPLSWGFMAFGILVIISMAVILLRMPEPAGLSATAAAKQADELKGLRGYLARMRMFSRNARLYIVHVVGMDVIFGTWTVVFNLYLLAIGFDVAFIGLRILLASLLQAIFSIPAGLISDRIGRKRSFILGDGGGAVMSLIAISTVDPTLLLLTAALGGAFGALHGVAEPAFMAENSNQAERVHLFSVASGTRIAATIIGSTLAGLVPLLLAGGDETAKIGLYRLVAYLGIAGWFASLIPALLLQQVAAPAARTGLRQLFAGVRHPERIWRLTAPEVLAAMGAGFALPLLNVFFKENLGSAEVEIGATFAAGQAVLVVGAFLVPLLAARLGKVRSVVWTRFAALPFILLIAFSPDVGTALGSVFTVAGLAHIARMTFANMASPVRSAFAMEILDPGERGTQVGVEMTFASIFAGLAAFLGAQMMAAGDFRTPFFLMAGCLLLANLLFWRFFGRWEQGQEQRAVAGPGEPAVAVE